MVSCARRVDSMPRNSKRRARRVRRAMSCHRSRGSRRIASMVREGCSRGVKTFQRRRRQRYSAAALTRARRLDQSACLARVKSRRSPPAHFPRHFRQVRRARYAAKSPLATRPGPAPLRGGKGASANLAVRPANRASYRARPAPTPGRRRLRQTSAVLAAVRGFAGRFRPGARVRGPERRAGGSTSRSRRRGTANAWLVRRSIGSSRRFFGCRRAFPRPSACLLAWRIHCAAVSGSAPARGADRLRVQRRSGGVGRPLLRARCYSPGFFPGPPANVLTF